MMLLNATSATSDLSCTCSCSSEAVTAGVLSIAAYQRCTPSFPVYSRESRFSVSCCQQTSLPPMQPDPPRQHRPFPRLNSSHAAHERQSTRDDCSNPSGVLVASTIGMTKTSFASAPSCFHFHLLELPLLLHEVDGLPLRRSLASSCINLPLFFLLLFGCVMFPSLLNVYLLPGMMPL